MEQTDETVQPKEEVGLVLFLLLVIAQIINLAGGRF